MKSFKNKEGGFIRYIILVVIILLGMQYFGITLTGIYYWLRDLFLTIL